MIARRFCALFLLVLTVSPFTAPFQACDARDPLPHGLAIAPAHRFLGNDTGLLSERLAAQLVAAHAASGARVIPDADAAGHAAAIGVSRLSGLVSPLAPPHPFLALRV